MSSAPKGVAYTFLVRAHRTVSGSEARYVSRDRNSSCTCTVVDTRYIGNTENDEQGSTIRPNKWLYILGCQGSELLKSTWNARLAYETFGGTVVLVSTTAPAPCSVSKRTQLPLARCHTQNT